MAGIFVPQQVHKDSLLDQVAKGMQIAQSVYGIKSDMVKQQQAEDAQNGIVTPAQAAALQPTHQLSDTETPGSIKLGIRTPDGSVKDVYATGLKLPKDTQKVGPGEALYQRNSDGGYDLVAGGGPKPMSEYQEFLASQKKEKPDPTGHWKSTGQVTPDNQLVMFNDLTGETKTTAIGGGLVKPGAGAKTTAADEKTIQHERDKLYDTFVKAGGRGEVGNLKKKIDGAEQLEGLIAQHPDGQFPPELQSELAMGLANLMNPNGGVTQAQIEHLDPKTRGTMIASFMEKLTNAPYDSNNPEFAKLFADSIERQKGVAQDQLNRTIAQARFGAPHLFDQKPDDFFGLVGGKKSDFKVDDSGNFAYVPKTIGKKGPGAKPESGTAVAAPAAAEVSESAVSMPKTPDAKISDYAKANSLDYMTARSILTGRGYKPNER